MPDLDICAAIVSKLAGERSEREPTHEHHVDRTGLVREQEVERLLPVPRDRDEKVGELELANHDLLVDEIVLPSRGVSDRAKRKEGLRVRTSTTRTCKGAGGGEADDAVSSCVE